MEIYFSKVWGQDEHRWNYCGGPWNFKTMTDLMSFYGIKEAEPVEKDFYYEDGKEQAIPCIVYRGVATKNYWP